MKKYLPSLQASFMLSLLIAGCASLGLQPATTFTDNLAYAWGVHTAVLQTIDTSVSSGRMSSSDGQKLLDQSDNATVILNAALAAYNLQDMPTANNKLALATVALTRIQDYLNTLPASK